MDIRKDGYFARLELPGNSMPVDLSGSIFSIIQESLRQLQQYDSRSPKKQIRLEISNHPLTVESIALQRKADEVMSYIDPSFITQVVRLDGESMQEMTDRLMEDNDPVTAAWLAHDAFGLEYKPDPLLTKWQTDPKAIRFRKIHSSQTSYDASDPVESAALESHCRELYPEYVAIMRLRN